MKLSLSLCVPVYQHWRYIAAGITGVWMLCGVSTAALSQPAGQTDQNLNWVSGAIARSQAMRFFGDEPMGMPQITPPFIPKTDKKGDPFGLIGTFQPGGHTITKENAFFQDLGSNGRTCFSCHQPENGWGLSAASVDDTFTQSAGLAPIFRLVVGAVCPNADVSTKQKRVEAYVLLLKKGLIRIGLPVPANAEFYISYVDDFYGCNTDTFTGLQHIGDPTTATTGILSFYRRPLPSTNLGFINTIMSDGREPSLESQATDATLGHAQAGKPPSSNQIAQIVAFEKGLLTAQVFDRHAHELNDDGATGGPKELRVTLANFFTGINDPLSGNPKGTPFSSFIFTLYDAWASLTGSDREAAARASIARGEVVFNTKPIAITGVAGLNDTLNIKTIHGFCGTCHDSPNVGNHSVKLPINIGTTNAGPFDAATGEGAVSVLDISGLPVFTVFCTAGPHAGATYKVTDLGRATISGKCADIGKVKGPILRGLAARAPYFHNGAATRLEDVVDFYNERFNVGERGEGFSDQEKTDLVNFLKTL